MAIYGAATGPVAEDTPPRAPLSGYGEAKRLCEALVHDYVRDGGDAVILRPGCIFGPGSAQWTVRIARLLRARRIGDLGAAGDGVCNLTYIDDLVQAIVTALKAPTLAGAAFNVADPEPVTWNEFLTAFGRALGATPIRRLPQRRIAVETRLVAPLLRIAAIAARGARLPAHRIPDAITPSLAALFRQDVRLLTDAAATRLNLAHTPLERAIDVSARWLDPGSRTAPLGKAACCDREMEVGRS
jgi:nucleoside-diphosphate-sugar epimerase